MTDLRLFAPRQPCLASWVAGLVQLAAFGASCAGGDRYHHAVLASSLALSAFTLFLGSRLISLAASAVRTPDGLLAGNRQIRAAQVRAAWAGVYAGTQYVFIAPRGFYVGLRNGRMFAQVQSASEADEVLASLSQGAGSAKRLRLGVSPWTAFAYVVLAALLIVPARTLGVPLWALEYLLVWAALAMALMPNWLVVGDDGITIERWYRGSTFIAYREMSDVGVVGAGDDSVAVISLTPNRRQRLFRCEMDAPELVSLMLARRGRGLAAC